MKKWLNRLLKVIAVASFSLACILAAWSFVTEYRICMMLEKCGRFQGPPSHGLIVHGGSPNLGHDYVAAGQDAIYHPAIWRDLRTELDLKRGRDDLLVYLGRIGSPDNTRVVAITVRHNISKANAFSLDWWSLDPTWSWFSRETDVKGGVAWWFPVPPDDEFPELENVTWGVLDDENTLIFSYRKDGRTSNLRLHLDSDGKLVEKGNAENDSASN